MAPLKFKILPNILQNIRKCPPVSLIQILRSFENGFKNRSAKLVYTGALCLCFDSFIEHVFEPIENSSGCHVCHVRRAMLRHHQVNLVESELLAIKNASNSSKKLSGAKIEPREPTVYRTF
jgi:hypothetical protein